MTARRPPIQAALPDIRLVVERQCNQLELMAQGLWPVPQGVTVYRVSHGHSRPYWRFLPDPAPPRLRDFTFRGSIPVRDWRRLYQGAKP